MIDQHTIKCPKCSCIWDRFNVTGLASHLEHIHRRGPERALQLARVAAGLPAIEAKVEEPMAFRADLFEPPAQLTGARLTMAKVFNERPIGRADIEAVLGREAGMA